MGRSLGMPPESKWQAHATRVACSRARVCVCTCVHGCMGVHMWPMEAVVWIDHSIGVLPVPAQHHALPSAALFSASGPIQCQRSYAAALCSGPIQCPWSCAVVLCSGPMQRPYSSAALRRSICSIVLSKYCWICSSSGLGSNLSRACPTNMYKLLIILHCAQPNQH